MKDPSGFWNMIHGHTQLHEATILDVFQSVNRRHYLYVASMQSVLHNFCRSFDPVTSAISHAPCLPFFFMFEYDIVVARRFYEGSAYEKVIFT